MSQGIVGSYPASNGGFVDRTVEEVMTRVERSEKFVIYPWGESAFTISREQAQSLHDALGRALEDKS